MSIRVAICWIGVSGYLAASWRALCARPGLAVKIFYAPAIGTTNAPFAGELTQGIEAEALTPAQTVDVEYVAARVAEHRPDIVVICGWVISGYTALPFHPKLAAAKFVMGMDTPRKTDGTGQFRQMLGRIKLRKLMRRMDRIVVPGERSWQYARYLGFEESQIRRGVYGVDVAQFQPMLAQRLSQERGWPRRFLFTGRYEAVKGIDVLLEAYSRYRQRHGDDAWPLTCCGKGPMAETIHDAGVEDLGFVQPPDQPALWARCGVFVLPSRYDPWPLVIVEACAAGLPVLCSEACGSAVELVRSYFNGLTVQTENAAELARGMTFMHEHYEQLPQMGQRGQPLAAAYSTEAYAERWGNMFEEMMRGAR